MFIHTYAVGFVNSYVFPVVSFHISNGLCIVHDCRAFLFGGQTQLGTNANLNIATMLTRLTLYTTLTKLTTLTIATKTSQRQEGEGD